jgi:type I restriction enzyme S subunit
MAGEWQEVSWGDLATLEYGRALRGHAESKGRFRVFGTNGAIGWHNEALCLHPGVIIGRKGAYRGVHYSPAPFFVIDTAFYLEPKREIDVRWAYYELLTQNINGIDSGSAIPSTSREAFYTLPVRVPPLPEQRAIAHILGTLDDKIELNRRMSEALVQMARALFKAWFVDFEPVRAKMEGRWQRGQSLPGLPAHLYDLFPGRLVDSELGEMPEGWAIRKLSDLCSTQYGYTASAVDEPIGPKFLRVTDINKQNWIEWGSVPHCEIDSHAKQAYALQIGDLVVARMADPGKSAIIEDDIDAVFASYLVRLKTNSLAHSYYVYGFLKSELYAEYAEGARSGSVQANMNARVIVGASLVVPPIEVMEQFLRAVLPLRQRLASNVRQSRTLAALRDALLPKLISGELRVKDAEQFLRERGL